MDHRNPCCTVLDVGFSSSVALPCIEGQMVPSAGRRLNVGGRVLTNLLSERLQFAQYDLTQSWLVAEDIMSKTCEVSMDFEADLHEGYRQVDPMTYVLPDFQTHCRGFVADAAAVPNGDTQRVTVKAERVAVPEALFHPKDHGICQVGVADLVRHAIQAVTSQSWRPHFGQVVVCGGLARLPNFCSRLFRDLRQSAPTDWPLNVIVEEEPELSVWRGAAQLARDSHFRQSHFRSRRAWEEEGTETLGSTGEKPAAKRVRT
jgi:actin-related protein 6